MINFEYKIYHNSKNINREKSENWFFIRFSTLRIFHESGIKTEGGGLHILSWEIPYKKIMLSLSSTQTKKKTFKIIRPYIFECSCRKKTNKNAAHFNRSPYWHPIGTQLKPPMRVLRSRTQTFRTLSFYFQFRKSFWLGFYAHHFSQK